MPDRPDDEPDERPEERPDEPQESASAGELTPREHLRKTLHIALLMSYDLIDKLRYLEKETSTLSDEQAQERTQRLVEALELLRSAYLGFAEQEP